jgi:hypothetical protein
MVAFDSSDLLLRVGDSTLQVVAQPADPELKVCDVHAFASLKISTVFWLALISHLALSGSN